MCSPAARIHQSRGVVSHKGRPSSAHYSPTLQLTTCCWQPLASDAFWGSCFRFWWPSSRRKLLKGSVVAWQLASKLQITFTFFLYNPAQGPLGLAEHLCWSR